MERIQGYTSLFVIQHPNPEPNVGNENLEYGMIEIERRNDDSVFYVQAFRNVE
jgi:hypothetical protein